MTAPKTRSPSRAGRLWDYLAVTFPPIPMAIAALIGFAMVYFSLEAVAFHTRLAYTWRALGAVATGYSMSLVLRIYDELKDVETDRRLAAAGDPKYMERPIVRGLVDVEDLRALQWVALGTAVVVNLFLGPVVLAAFAVFLVMAWMSSRWFFWPKMRDHLMVAFVTHNPLTLLLQAYGAVVYMQDFGSATLPLGALLAVLVAQQGFASAWEVSREIRAPDEETDYVTYSRVLSYRAALLIPAVAVVSTAGCVLWVGTLAELHLAYLVAVALSAVVTLGVLLRFFLAPSARTSKALRPFVEAFAAVVNVGGAIALVVRWGLTLAPIK